VGTVGATAGLGRLVDLDVDDLEQVDVELLVLKKISNQSQISTRSKRDRTNLSVGLSVLQKVEDVLDRLGGPADLTGTVVLVHLALSLATNARDEAAEGDGLLVVKDVLEVLLSIAESAALDGVRGLTSVLGSHKINCRGSNKSGTAAHLEVNLEVRAPRVDALGGVSGLLRVLARPKIEGNLTSRTLGAHARIQKLKGGKPGQKSKFSMVGILKQFPHMVLLKG